ncbi:hypothetical protein [Methanoregula sp.]|uniref:hypothetical protein n=1 Tax=Methanoregula sp. TaxID=2052170 RepID=UPI00356A9EFE
MYRDAGCAPDGTPYFADLAEVRAAARDKRDPHFDELRDARLRMGHLRYGVCGRSADASYDVVASMISRLEEYRKTGNREHLVDIANLAEIEWIGPQREGTYWAAQDTGGHWSLRNQEAPAPPALPAANCDGFLFELEGDP